MANMNEMVGEAERYMWESAEKWRALCESGGGNTMSITPEGAEPDPRETLNRIIAGAIYDFAQRMTSAPNDPQSMATAAAQFLDSHGCKFSGEPPKDWSVMIDQLVDDDHPSDMYDDLASLVDRHWDETSPGELMVALGCVIQEREQEDGGVESYFRRPELPEPMMHQTMADAFAAGFASLRK